MTAVLWKTVQEQMESIDKLENEVAELKGKGKGKALKANPKAKGSDNSKYKYNIIYTNGT